jgi:hypothetical protein
MNDTAISIEGMCDDALRALLGYIEVALSHIICPQATQK